MKKCKICGSYAINDGQCGRAAGIDLDLCDVCYWQQRAETMAENYRLLLIFASDLYDIAENGLMCDDLLAMRGVKALVQDDWAKLVDRAAIADAYHWLEIKERDDKGGASDDTENQKDLDL